MASKEPKTRCNGEMTEAQYLGWIRSALRSKSLRWKPRGHALKLARRAYVGTNKLQKWEYECALCRDWFLAKECQVDHYPKEAGSIRSVEDIGEFANNLFCEVDNLRVLCGDCHSIHTLAQRGNISFEEAKKQQILNTFLKQDKQIILDFLEVNGYTGASVSNEDKRKAIVKQIMEEN